MRIALGKLDTANANTVLEVLKDIIQISRSKPALVKSHMATIYSACAKLVLHPRSPISTAGCHIAGELFQTIQCTSRPVFDELVSVLFRRTVTGTEA
jgi:hypothetical protein